ncbi:carbon-monoxide dehydrogenase small subunit [Halomonas alkaliantarctica]|nr:carbon-monoxide dehydrogenase small subunit [Halomonas alkaliantarctica]
MTNDLNIRSHDERSIKLTVNGEKREALVSSRDILADVIREKFRLTGTHIGCDQGACGACTILIDGIPQRSCIAFAVDCDNTQITTIEGFDEDPTMQDLRSSFSKHHALQCGFCTSGMLVSARDIVLRLGETDESRIKMELAGNLCRCTGYTGIVDAVYSAAKGKQPVGSAGPAIELSKVDDDQVTVENSSEAVEVEPRVKQFEKSDDFPNSIHQSINVDLPPSEAWAVVRDLKTAASCIPGAEVVSLNDSEVSGKMNMALGPIRANFTGDGTYEINDENYEGWMTAGGRDAMTGSTVTGRITWSVKGDGSSGSLIEVELAWKLTGALAQFGRGGIVTETVRRLATMFGENLEQLLREGSLSETRNQSVGFRTLIWPVIKSLVAKIFTRNHSK